MNLREYTKAAELQAKLPIAYEDTALARRNTKLLDLEALELDSNICKLLGLKYVILGNNGNNR